MFSYATRRLVYGVVVIWVALTILFIIVRVIPGNPALLILGPDASRDQIEAFERRLGLDQPLAVQYVDYITGAARLDFGTSIRLGGPAMNHVVARLPASLVLALAATTLAVGIGVPLGVAAARRPGGIVDRVVSTTVLVGQSIPPFWLGIVMIIIFARTLRWLPSGGARDGIQSLILPAVSLAVPFLAMTTRLSRGGMLEVLSEDYVDTARSKGLKSRRILYRHAVPNMLIPVVTVVGLQFGSLIGGAVIVETVFGWPGVGRLLIEAINTRDYAVVQAAAAMLAVVFIVLNLVVDLVYAILDPRVRLTGKVAA